jgi:CRP-like cAMP-binding protein
MTHLPSPFGVDFPLNSSEQQELTPYITPKSFKKNDTIFPQGKTCNELFIMHKGLVRCFYILEDKDVNLRLLCDQSAVLAYSSFIKQTPSIESIQCLQNCEGFMLSLGHIKTLRRQLPIITEYERIMAEQHYLAMERRLHTIQYKSAEQHYHHFIKEMPKKIVTETPAHHIAAYLGITPESFSRVKRKLYI